MWKYEARRADEEDEQAEKGGDLRVSGRSDTTSKAHDTSPSHTTRSCPENYAQNGHERDSHESGYAFERMNNSVCRFPDELCIL